MVRFLPRTLDLAIGEYICNVFIISDAVRVNGGLCKGCIHSEFLEHSNSCFKELNEERHVTKPLQIE